MNSYCFAKTKKKTDYAQVYVNWQRRVAAMTAGEALFAEMRIINRGGCGVSRSVVLLRPPRNSTQIIARPMECCCEATSDPLTRYGVVVLDEEVMVVVTNQCLYLEL
jgi:hypothetical protein